jgi:hypothetical protein
VDKAIRHSLKEMVADSTSTCTLVAGIYDDMMQVLLGLVAVSALLVKRHYEQPRRPKHVWVMDTSKQCIGALWAHGLNVALAAGLAAKSKGSDQCAFYFINFTLDTTVGVALNWALMLALQRAAGKYGWSTLKHSGAYGPSAPFLRTWSVQLASWLVIVAVMKMIILAFIFGFVQQLANLGNDIFAPLQDNPKLELLLVMILCPCLMNMVQFWVQDNFLKKAGGDGSETGGCGGGARGEGLESLGEPLTGGEAPELQMELGLYHALRVCHPSCLCVLRCPCPGKVSLAAAFPASRPALHRASPPYSHARNTNRTHRPPAALEGGQLYARYQGRCGWR